MVKKDYDWVNFYIEFADKLLDFKDNRVKLIDKLKNTSPKTINDLSKLEKDLKGNHIVPSDIDPFTVMGLFNRDINDESRMKIVDGLKKEFSISEKTPSVFDGIPTINWAKPRLYNFEYEGRKEDDISNLWEFFEAALNFSKSNDEQCHNEFIKWYDKVKGQGQVGKTNLTCGLFWIRPNTFIGLDKNNINLLKKESILDDELLKIIDKYPSGEEYLEICRKCSLSFKKSNKYEDFIDFSCNAYLNKNDVVSGNKTENKKEFVVEEFYLDDSLFKEELKEFIISDDLIYQLCASLTAGKHIILEGVPGTGKTELSTKLSNVAVKTKGIDGYILTTATSDWSTFDTIGGLIPEESRKLIFHQGKFLEAIASNKWLIIDEINRADIDKAFGQLFTVLSGHDVELPYKKNDNSIKIKNWDENLSKYDSDSATYYIGKNWRIIGTMNVDDKDNLFDLSYAFMRRFMFIDIEVPEKSEYSNLIRKWAGDLNGLIVDKIVMLANINDYKKIGPAIFKDLIEYIGQRTSTNDDYDLILSEAVVSYILPQLEGLNQGNIENIKDLFKELEIFYYLKDHFNEFNHAV